MTLGAYTGADPKRFAFNTVVNNGFGGVVCGGSYKPACVIAETNGGPNFSSACSPDSTSCPRSPVPNSAATFRYTKVRLLKSAGNGANTIDLMRSWSQYLVYAVGANVALDNSLFDRSQQLLAYAEKVRPKAEANESQHGRIRFRIGNSGRNW